MFKKNKAMLPVYCSACNWEHVPLLSDLKCIPGSGKPISRPLDNKEEQFKTVSMDIYAVACKIKQEDQDKENEAREMQQKSIEFRESIDSAFRENNIVALISISRELPKGNDDILREIIDYIKILNAQSENL